MRGRNPRACRREKRVVPIPKKDSQSRTLNVLLQGNNEKRKESTSSQHKKKKTWKREKKGKKKPYTLVARDINRQSLTGLADGMSCKGGKMQGEKKGQRPMWGGKAKNAKKLERGEEEFITVKERPVAPNPSH